MAPAVARFYEFGPFRLDTVERVLYREGSPVPLTSKACETLLALVRHHGQLLDKRELMRMVWPDTVVEENNLNQSISFLRKALADGHPEGHYIETVPRRGFRFVAEIRHLNRTAGPAPGLTAVWRGALLAALVLLMALGTWRAWTPARPSARRVQSLAVLPFQNLSGDPEQEYLADGMTEALIADLAKIKALRVISRTSVMQFKATRKLLPELARALRVDAVLEGSVVRAGIRVRISVQLIEAASDHHLWSATYERDFRDVLALQGEVARAVAQEIEVTVTSQERARLGVGGAADPEAHRLYLKGRYHWNKRNPGGFRKAREYFQQAIDRDPTYAPAYSGLSDTYGLIGLTEYAVVPAREAMKLARAAALKALELDDTLAEAHASLAGAVRVYEWDWATAERHFRRALELNPGYATAHHWYGIGLASLGRAAEASAELERALELDPLSPIISTDLGWVWYLARRYDASIEQLRKTLELEPAFPQAHLSRFERHAPTRGDTKRPVYAASSDTRSAQWKGAVSIVAIP